MPHANAITTRNSTPLQPPKLTPFERPPMSTHPREMRCAAPFPKALVTVSPTKYGLLFEATHPDRARPPQSARILYDAGDLYIVPALQHLNQDESPHRDLCGRRPGRYPSGTRFPLRNLELLLAAPGSRRLLTLANHSGYPFG